MTDLELTKACAEAMGYQWSAPRHEAQWLNSDNGVGGLRKRWKHYDPLHDKAQCFALIETFDMTITRVNSIDGYWRARAWEGSLSYEADANSLNRAICTAVANRPAK